MTKSDAFLAQAQSDLRVFSILIEMNRESVSECHVLHYLQMASEKLAKAILIRNNIEVNKSHVSPSKLPGRLKNRNLASSLGYKNFRAYMAFLKRITPLMQDIEKLNPAVASANENMPNVEYPWFGRDNQLNDAWLVPANHDFGIVKKLKSQGSARQLLVLFRLLIDRFHQGIS